MPRRIEWLHRLAKEPPFRVLVRGFLSRVSASVDTRALWELSSRPAYLVGVLEAARQASRQGVNSISTIEFGVAGGSGLLALEREAAAVEAETGVRIEVYGFDAGGLPQLIGDHRDHPDVWRAGDYPMDQAALQSRLSSRTTLIIGNIKDTVPRFVERSGASPVGFISIDVDLYSSARAALEILSLPGKRMLHRVPLYFDDVASVFNHRYAGELLAINEFNSQEYGVKIDRWRGIANDRPFPERSFLSCMYVAHDLQAISEAKLAREPVHLPATPQA